MEGKALLLEGLPDQLASVKSKLFLYFKNKRKSGGEVSEIQDHPSDSKKALLLYFDDEDVEKVLQKGKHVLHFKDRGYVDLWVSLPPTKSGENAPLCGHSVENPEKSSWGAKEEQEELPFHREESQKGENKDQDVTLLVSSQRPVPEDLLSLYFEQFSDEVQIIKHEEKKWILKLPRKSDAEKVLATKEHNINGSALEIYDESAGESKLDPRRFILRGFSGDCKHELIPIYIKSCSNGAEHSWEVLSDEASIAVTFKEDINVESFLKKCSSKKLQKLQITVSRLERTDSILVKGEMKKISEEMLILYFNSKRSKGGEIKSLNWVDSTSSALVTFEDWHVAHRVAEQKHHLCGVSLSTQLFYCTLQEVLSGQTTPKPSSPRKIASSVDCAYLDSIYQHERVKEHFERTLKEVHSVISIDRNVVPPQVMLELVVDPDCLLFYQVAPDWESKTRKAMQELLEKYNVFLVAAKLEVWERIKDRCFNMNSDNISVSYDSTNCTIVVVGHLSEARCTEDNIKVLVHDTNVELEIERTTVERNFPVQGKEELDFLWNLVSGKLGDVESLKDEDSLSIHLKGLQDRVGSAEQIVKEAYSNLATKTLNVSAHMLEFLRSLDMKKFEAELFTPNCISAVIFNQGNDYQILAEKKYIIEAENKIKVLEEEVIDLTPEQAELTDNENWRNFCNKLNKDVESCSSTRKANILHKDKQIIIIGFGSVVTDITRKLKGYLNNKMPTTAEVPLKSEQEMELINDCMNLLEEPDIKALDVTVLPSKVLDSFCLKVTAAQENIQDAVSAVKKQITRIVSEKHTFSNAGEFKVLEKSQAALKARGKEFGCKLFFSNEKTSNGNPGTLEKDASKRLDIRAALEKLRTSPRNKEKKTPPPVAPKIATDTKMLVGYMLVVLKKGDITKECVDAIVNSTNSTLNLNSGVSGAILAAAGKSVTDECTKLGTQKADAVVLTGGGSLQCKHIIQMVGPTTTDGITASIQKVLQLCESQKCTSVSIPAIGTGKGNIGAEQSIQAILKGLENHSAQKAPSCIRSTFIVAFEQKVFDSYCHYFAEKNQLPLKKQACSLPSSASAQPDLRHLPDHQVKIHNVRLEVKKGNIVLETVRGIINTTNKDLNLTGGVSGAIFRAAGNTVEEECKRLAPLKNDTVVVTSGGSLQCDFIIHMLGPHSTAEVTSRLERVLEECEKNQITTVCFPAVGTGGGGLKAKDAAIAMLQGFENHLSRQPSSVLKLVYFVIDQDQIMEDFLEGFKNWTAKTVTGSRGQLGEKDKEDGSTTSENEDLNAASGSIEVIMGPIKVKALYGDITKETTDAIVSSTNTTLNLNSGVSGAILKAAGSTVVDECTALGTQPDDGVVITKAGNLQTKHIVHMVGQTKEKNITKSMIKVLKACDGIKVQSVAFPVLGTGAGNLSADSVAAAMVEAISNFQRDHPNTSLTLIHIVIFQQKMIYSFEEVMKKYKKITPKKAAENTAQVHSSTSASAQAQMYCNRKTLTLASLMDSVSYTAMTVEVYGTSTSSLAQVKQCLEKLLREECSSQEVEMPNLHLLQESEKQDIATLAQKHQVWITDQSNKFTVSGKNDDVLMVALQMKDLAQKAKERKNQKQEEERVWRTVRWEKATGDSWRAMDSSVSYKLELGFHNKEKTYKYEKKGEKFTVDFEQMQQTDSKGRTVKIKRTLLAGSDTAVIPTPPTWTKMDGKDLVVVPLSPTSEEYQKIAKEFVQSCQYFAQTNNKTIEVVQIRRVQNTEQWQRYVVRKQAVDKKYPNKKNEQILYHGTTKDISQKINISGFNRSFCGRNATRFGYGTYFAREAYYSCDDRYSSPDKNGHKYMYRARVLTGKPCLANEEMKEPAALNPSDPRDGLHDCAVDNLKNPFIYVIFCDSGAYPEYLLSFKTV